jgi:transposase-like protein
MVAYKFTARRRQIYQLYASGKDPRDIAKVVKLPSIRVWQIIKKIEEMIPKSQLADFFPKKP